MSNNKIYITKEDIKSFEAISSKIESAKELHSRFEFLDAQEVVITITQGNLSLNMIASSCIATDRNMDSDEFQAPVSVLTEILSLCCTAVQKDINELQENLDEYDFDLEVG